MRGSGRMRRLNGGRRTERPSSADRKSASMTRTSASPSSPLAPEAHQAPPPGRTARTEALVRVARPEGDPLDRLGAEEVARGVDAVHADVPNGAAAQLGLRPDVVLLHLIGEVRAEEAWLAE